MFINKEENQKVIIFKGKEKIFNNFLRKKLKNQKINHKIKKVT
jgi:hypothetical protein